MPNHGTVYQIRRAIISLCMLASVAYSSKMDIDAVAKSIQPPEHASIRVLITEQGFEPNRVQIKLGRPIRLDIRNLSGKPHTFVLPDYDVYSCILLRGDAAYIEFVPDKSGDFEFYSDASNTEGEPHGKITVR